jgi:site-specific DNA recombinase
MDKLLDAYPEGLIPIAQLRKRMPELQKRVNTKEKELENLRAHELALDQRLQLLDVPTFKTQLGQNVNHLDIREKKKILRLPVKEIVVGDDVLDIKHSIPLKEAQDENNKKSYQLCTRSAITTTFQYRIRRTGQRTGDAGAQV